MLPLPLKMLLVCLTQFFFSLWQSLSVSRPYMGQFATFARTKFVLFCTVCLLLVAGCTLGALLFSAVLANLAIQSQFVCIHCLSDLVSFERPPSFVH